MKKSLKDLIAKGKTGMVIEKLLDISNKSKGSDFQEEVLLQSARYHTYTKAKRQGTIALEKQDLNLAQINSALLQLINELPDDLQPGEQKANIYTSKRPWWQWIIAICIIISIPAGMSDFTGFSLIDLFSGRNIEPFSITVLVHGKEGKDDRILRNQGKVVLDFGTTREEAAVNYKGEATFKELPSGYEDKKALISIDHPQPYFPTNRHAEYILERGKAIYLEVSLMGLDKVQGRVLDYETEEPLDSVWVSYKDIETYTDNFGWYELTIPPNKQKKFIYLNYYRTGYDMERIDSVAPHTGQEISIFLKRK